MSWLDNLRSRGGPLVGPAGRLLQPGALGPDFHGGADGLIALARRLEAHCDGETTEDDATFIEAAGALLGLILIDHLGRAQHAARDGRHRVQLGARGFFDPFRAIESALEAEDIRRHLAREVARAEAEAAGRGPLSAFVEAFERILAEQRPELRVTDQFETRLCLSDGSEVDVARSVRATVGEPERARLSAARRLVSMLPRAGERHAPFAQVAPQLFPRLCRPETFEELAAQGRGRIHQRPFVPGLAVALVIADDGRCRYAREDEVDAWRTEGGAPCAQALTNLAAASKAARFARIETDDGPLVLAKTGDGHDSARVLLPGLREVLAPELGDCVHLAIPHRDLLLACAAGQAPVTAALRERATRDFARAPHPLLDGLLVLDREGIRSAR